MSFLSFYSSYEGLWQQQPETEAVLNGKGLGTDGSGLGFSLEYPTISLDAVSRDLNAYPQEHLHAMVNAKFGEESKESVEEEEEGEEGNSNDDVEPIAEFRFVPSDKSALEAMFPAMCECQVLHPDPDNEDSDDYDGGEYDVETHAEDGTEVDTTAVVAGHLEDAHVHHGKWFMLLQDSARNCRKEPGASSAVEWVLLKVFVLLQNLPEPVLF
uniref:Methylosome subunit pICln n=1 Tax=Suricata suricatta TaxID=37032 RepID=A0A673SLN8_SURSU